MEHPAVESLDLDAKVAHYGELVVDLRRAGTLLPTNDIWIAATAIHAGASVLTFDVHFRAIARVGVLLLEA